MDLLVKRLSLEAVVPKKAYDTDAGFDLFSRTHITLLPNERHLFFTDIAAKLPDGYCGIIKDRSGNSIKMGIHVLAGVIDNDYTGHIKVCLVNLSKNPVVIDIGDKIAQMLIVPVPQVDIVVVNDLPNTSRGSAGFGSSD